MRKLLCAASVLILLIFKAVGAIYAQQRNSGRLIQFYQDDDYINFYGNGTDKAYTSGTKYSLFYTKKTPSNFLIDRLLPKAGDSSHNVYGIGLSQLIVTPDNIAIPDFQPDDYPWSGALYLSRSLYAYNTLQKYDFQTSLDIGVTGPASLARQIQEAAHHLVNYQQPKGWANQFGNSLLLNLNFTAEKQVLHFGKFLEIIAGGQVSIGTGINATAAYTTIRIGKMNPYFDGLINQYSHSATDNKVQFYFIFKPRVQLTLSNALLQGGIGSSRPAPILVSEKNGSPSNSAYYHPINPIIAGYSYGAVVVINRFSISSIQTTTTAWMKGLYGLTWGNFTLTYSL
uniref:lipid A-modifier LpxR family protein n=1 Tax=Pedobacter schmidteae TaxID=2201271 RepID=UPI000EB3E483|nr:lipid A-modifier LpxR family protein [Pedobacter schmidteae]